MAAQHMVYATLADVRRYLALDSTQTGDDNRLIQVLDTASRLIDGFTGRQFVPVQAARRYSVQDARLLLLDADLLALSAVTNGDGSAIPLEAVHPQPPNAAVASSLLLDRTRAVFTHNGDPVDAITVTGVWGYHPDWAHAWGESGDTVQDAPLSASATVITVSDADAPLAAGYGTPFAVGHLLRIEDEYVLVRAVDAVANTLTVTRGVNGTIAASHASGTGIDVYAVPADVHGACLRLASWLYKQPDAGRDPADAHAVCARARRVGGPHPLARWRSVFPPLHARRGGWRVRQNGQFVNCPYECIAR